MIPAIALLDKMLERKAIPHALLFVGCSEERAYAFASAAILQSCPAAARKLESKRHPDIHVFHPEGRTGMHAVEQMHRLTLEVAMNCSEAPCKFLIINEAERCLPTSSNALLKTLEEPASHSVIILLTTKPEKMLPTVLSRCQKIVFEVKGRVQTELQRRFLHLLTPSFSWEGVELLVRGVEEERKEWEKRMVRELPKELTPLMRERLEKEIEGASTLEFQERAFSLFETFLLWSRDVTLVKGGIESNLTYPDHLEYLKVSCPLPYMHVEKRVQQMKLSVERSTSLHTCLKALFLRFGYL